MSCHKQSTLQLTCSYTAGTLPFSLGTLRPEPLDFIRQLSYHQTTLLSKGFLVVSHLGTPKGGRKLTCMHVNISIFIAQFLMKSTGSG